MEQAIADFEGQWTGKDFYVVTSLTAAAKRRLIPCPFRTDYMAIFLVIDGTARVRLDNVDYTLRKNSLMVVSPRTIRDLSHFSTDVTVMGLIFTRSFVTRLGVKEQEAPLGDVFSIQHNPYFLLEQADADTLAALLRLLSAKCAKAHEAPYAEDVIRHHFMAFIYELASHLQPPVVRKIKRTRKEELHLRFQQMLADHVRQERSVRFYAAKLYVTPKYLTETTKEVTGKTAGELIDEMVMREAKLLLNDTALSVTDIAGELHFSDQFFFRKFFKRHQGLTPTEFRRAV
jgi:AraC-like DNA-binding protein